MEPSVSPPFKRVRMVANINECVREFKLRQQFPSMVSPVKAGNTLIKLKHVCNVNKLSQSPVAKNVVLVLNKEAHSLCKLQKSRIKSIGGRDLGEIKLQPMSHNDAAESIRISSNVHSASKKNRTACQSNIKWLQKCLPSLSNGDANTQRRIDKSSLNDNRLQNQINDIGNVYNVSHSSTKKLVTKRLLSENENNRGSTTNNQNCTSPTVTRKLNYVTLKNNKDTKQIPLTYSTECKKKFVRVSMNQKLLTMRRNKSDYSDICEKQNAHNLGISESKVKRKKVVSNFSEENSVMSPKSVQHKKLAESKFPLVKCKKLSLPVSKISLTEENVKDIKEDVTESYRENVYNKVTHVSTSSILSSSKCLIAKSNILDNVPSRTMHNSNCDKPGENDKSTSNINMDTNTFASTIREFQVRHVDSSLETDNNGGNKNEMTIKEREVQDCAVSNSINSVGNRSPNNNDNKNSEYPGLSFNWSILQEAVNSVPDKELRAKALQALAACGTGSERKLPILAPNYMKTVQDSTIQTEVFGLIDNNNFVLVRENLPEIERINQVERASLPLPRKHIDTPNQCNFFFDDELLPPILPSVPINLDEVFTDFIGASAEATKINNIVNSAAQNSNSVQICNKIYKQLQKDFDTFKQYDEFGFLNIHRAVILSRLQDVNRHIMILQACKESVDISTKDGKTSLELAINFDVGLELVNTLLEAGAQPARHKPIHDSALIIASKMSSSMLRELVKYVSNDGPLSKREQLDQQDSRGFTALHYCAQKGNKEGVSILLRAGASVNLQDNRSGRTALFHAAENEYTDIMQELFNFGASPNIPNFAGQTVLSLTDVHKSALFKSSLNRFIQ